MINAVTNNGQNDVIDNILFSASIGTLAGRTIANLTLLYLAYQKVKHSSAPLVSIRFLKTYVKECNTLYTEDYFTIGKVKLSVIDGITTFGTLAGTVYAVFRTTLP